MKKVVIVGKGSNARRIKFYLDHYSDRDAVAFSVNRSYMEKENESYCGCPVVPFETIEKSYPPDQFDAILGVGYGEMNRQREKMFRLCKEKGYTIASFIHPSADVSKGVKIGEGVFINHLAIIEPFVSIGDGNVINHACAIGHDSICGDFNFLAGGAYLAGEVTMGSHCFVGLRGIIHNAIKVADYTFVGAGAFVTEDTMPYDVITAPKSNTMVRKEGRQNSLRAMQMFVHKTNP